jgi:membrane-bound ClpP family serine protease
VRYIASSDEQLVAAHKAVACDEVELLIARREGKFVVSYETPGGWVGIWKTMLSEVLGEGSDVKIAGLPSAAAGALILMCRDLAVVGQRD